MARKSSGTKGEHIFPATVVTGLAIRWKELVAEGRQSEAQDVLTDIIKQSEQMYIRLAQYEGFHHTVDLPSLIQKANSLTAKWLTYWHPKKGKLFSWLSKCAKHAFLAEVVRTSMYRKRYYSTDDTLEKFIGAEDHQVAKNEAVASFQDYLKEIVSRWGDEQVLECARFHILCISESPETNKRIVIQSGAYVSGISVDVSKFLYSWALIALRDAIYDKVTPRFTEQDLFRLTNSYTYLPDMLNIITWEQMMKFIAVFGGMRIKIPTLSQINKIKSDYKVYRQIASSDLDPDTIAGIAKHNSISQRSAQEIYERMSESIHGDRDGESHLFGENDDPLLSSTNETLASSTEEDEHDAY